jgi:FkbM family methyltransferase
MLKNSYHLPIVIKLRGFARKIGILGVVKKLVRVDTYEQPFHEALEDAVKLNDVVWDIGANIGLYTNQFAEWVGSAGSVIGFEPVPETFEILKKNTEDNYNVNLFCAALSDFEGNAFFIVDGESNVTSHLAENATDNKIIEIKVNKADEFIEQDGKIQPNVVKIDVEGFEEDVLKGGPKVFSNIKCREILIEMHFEQMAKRNQGDSANRIVKMLINWGYKVNWTDSSHLRATRY